MGIILKYAQKAVAIRTSYYLFTFLQINESVPRRIIAATIVVITLYDRPWHYSLNLIWHIWCRNITSEDVTVIREDFQRLHIRIMEGQDSANYRFSLLLFITITIYRYYHIYML